MIRENVDAIGIDYDILAGRQEGDHQRQGGDIGNAFAGIAEPEGCDGGGKQDLDR